MRRLFFNIFVSVITFVIGLIAGAFQSALITPDPVASTEPVSTVTVISPPAPVNYPEKPYINGGVLNSKAIKLPQPGYPSVARAARQSGTVTVQAIVDENGHVISARAIAGPPLLKAAAVDAAYEAIFSPTRLSGKPVKITGVITYNFSLQ